jgi:hypothetical protein
MKVLNGSACKREILERFDRLRPAAPRRWGKMNAAQMVCHLSDSFLGAMGERTISPARSIFWRQMRWAALYMPMHWPHGVPTRPEADPFADGTQPVYFDEDVRSLFAVIERFVRTPRDFEFQPHPMFREMTEAEWMRWGYLHCDHHLRQFGL